MERIQKTPKVRKIMIGTPAYDGRVDVRYVNAVLETICFAPPNTRVHPVFVPGDALVQRARNYLVKIAIDSQVDDLVMIDSDMSWDPDAFWRLMSHDVDFVGGLTRQKTDDVVLTIRMHKNAVLLESNLLEVDGVGGMVRLSSTALQKLWKSSAMYKNGDLYSRMVYEVRVKKGELIGEDLVVCEKWREMHGHVYVDTSVYCDHIGSKVYSIDRPSLPLEKIDDKGTSR